MQEGAKQRVERLFARQEGLAGVGQLVELGLSRDVVRARPLRGPWRLVLPRVVCRDIRPLDVRQRLVAATLMAGSDSVISSWSAATWHGLRAVATSAKWWWPCPPSGSSGPMPS
jgi:hypothetical protein